MQATAKTKLQNLWTQSSFSSQRTTRMKRHHLSGGTEKHQLHSFLVTKLSHPFYILRLRVDTTFNCAPPPPVTHVVLFCCAFPWCCSMYYGESGRSWLAWGGLAFTEPITKYCSGSSQGTAETRGRDAGTKPDSTTELTSLFRPFPLSQTIMFFFSFFHVRREIRGRMHL